MWANDFPHSDSTWPWSQEMLAEHTADLTEHEQQPDPARQRGRAVPPAGRPQRRELTRDRRGGRRQPWAGLLGRRKNVLRRRSRIGPSPHEVRLGKSAGCRPNDDAGEFLSLPLRILDR